MQRLACPGARRAPFRGCALVGFTLLEARIAFAELFVACGFGFRVWSGLRPASFIAGGCVERKISTLVGARRVSPPSSASLRAPRRATGPRRRAQQLAAAALAPARGSARRAGCVGLAGRDADGVTRSWLEPWTAEQLSLPAALRPGRHARARAARHHARARRTSNRPTNPTNAGTHAF